MDNKRNGMTFTMKDDPILDPQHPPILHLLQIPSSAGFLVGRLYSPQGSGPHPLVVLAHGFPGSELNFDLAVHLQGLGYHALVFHYRGAWGSEGDFSMTGALEDVASVLTYMRQPDTAEECGIDTDRIALVGHSFGGFLALMTAAQDPSVAACASIAGANYGLLLEQIVSKPEPRAQMEEMFEYAASFLKGYTSKKYCDEIANYGGKWNTIDYAPQLASRPLLLIGAEQDALLPNAQHHDPLVAAIERTGGGNLRHGVFEATGHGFAGKRKTLAHLIGEWVLEAMPIA